MLGISVKVWQLSWEETPKEFTIPDSSVFVFQDRGTEDLFYIRTVLRHLIGDESLDDIFNHSLPSFRGEDNSKANLNPSEPVVKLETKETNLTHPANIDNCEEKKFIKDNEDFQDNLEQCDNDVNNGITTDNLLSEKRGSKNGEFSCDICYKLLKTEKALIRHKNKTHSIYKDKKESKQFYCDIGGCEEVFILRKLLWNHMLTDHGIDISPENKERFVCPVCGKKCPSKHDLEKHVLKHTNQKNFVCVECGKQFKGETGLKVHIKRHQGIFDHKCDDCDAAYTSASALNAHRLAKHTPGHSFMCPECGQEFKYQNALDKHITIHTGEKRYQCRYCEKKFRLFTIRANHERVHRGIKEFQCSMCAKQFMQQDQLRVHIKRHLNQRDHICKLCTKAFIEPVGLRKHICSGKVPDNLLHCEYAR